MKSRYKMQKAQARQEAIDYQAKSSLESSSLGELVEKQVYFAKLAKRFGLAKEFKENGIL